MANYMDLYDQSDKPNLDHYPTGDTAEGLPKGKNKTLIKNKVSKGGTKVKKTGLTTTGPDDRMNVSDMDKTAPESNKMK